MFLNKFNNTIILMEINSKVQKGSFQQQFITVSSVTIVLV